MADVVVGDQLLGADGRPTTVVAATDVLHGRPCYEVEFSDGTVVVADAQHQWLTETRASRKSAWAAARGYNRARTQRIHPSVKTTEEVLATLRCNGTERRLNHAVMNTRPLDLPAQELPLPPYALGAWLGAAMRRARGSRPPTPRSSSISRQTGCGSSPAVGCSTACASLSAYPLRNVPASCAASSSVRRLPRSARAAGHAEAGRALSRHLLRPPPAPTAGNRPAGWPNARRAGTITARCRGYCAASASWATSTFPRSTCGHRRCSGGRSSPGC